MSDASFYFHDYETWGANPHYDRPSQFAGLRTNLELEPCGRPLTLFSQPTPDFLPHPQAVLVTGITPQFALAQGTNEASFAAAIAAQMSVPNTTIIGYNNIAFDDEVTRHLFYRNFHDPYAHTWQQQNSRWDLIDLMRACYALRPEGIEWPYHDDGRVSMRLEDLSKANGIEHANAHDAMADVHATIGMARKVKQAQPRLFAYAYGLRRKQAVQQLIDLVNFEPRVHISGFYGALNGYVSVIMPLGYHPEQPNTLLYWDLRHNPLEFLESSLDDLVERRFTPRKQLAEQGLSAFAGGTLQLNRCPFIAKLNVLDSSAQQRWNLDLEQLERHRQALLAQSELRDRLCQALLTSKTYDAVTDPDFMLYSGPFFSEQDRSNMDIIRNTAPEQLPGLTLNFSDSRLPEMLFRYRARNYPSTLTDSELLKWREFCQGRLLSPPPGGLSAERFMQELELAAQQHSDNSRNMRLLNDLLRYAQSL
ncbi:exodeoxyribonuclease I [Pseudidiomarina sp. GXY010]|uniref:Exodeoxyribonuclease I n=1 Tax=Pseudidiomarina fusca TaxID=2965078 RepID=A0ABU3KVW7_9GAMM|nr:exodeoxyribonuclease I [Pseudidiomarina sp. GXY010]MDT7525031.1 exodeoxyribonuclease I [Pseudidiomarina sp. GXY010]